MLLLKFELKLTCTYFYESIRLWVQVNCIWAICAGTFGYTVYSWKSNPRPLGDLSVCAGMCATTPFVNYRQDLPQAALPVLFLLTGQFLGFSPRRGDTLHRSRSNLAGRSGPMVPFSLPNLTLIGATCRPCGAKNPKIGPWVKTIPAELPAANPAGN